MANARTRHPCAGMTKAQKKAFEMIATGRDYGLHASSVDALVAAGLVLRLRDQIIGRDAFGAISVPRYEVPLPVHMQWCQWCAENVEDFDATG